jgi:hypothetical protein
VPRLSMGDLLSDMPHSIKVLFGFQWNWNFKRHPYRQLFRPKEEGSFPFCREGLWE